MTTVFAPAKINLALHVTGQRGDGYHLLDSLVVFAAIGDRVSVAPAPDLTLRVTGPQAPMLAATDDNLVLRAARAYAALHPARTCGAAITLDKVLPVASGIGGGSADAAATLHALSALWDLPLPPAPVVLALGADVPVCLAGQPARMTGIGEVAMPLPTLPQVWVVLVNPGVAVPTPAVFAALTQKSHPAMPAMPRDWRDIHAFVTFLAAQRNDLAPPARSIAPVIATVEAALAATPGCLLARMSGSGATCFGLYASASAAAQAAALLRAQGPGWWVADAPLCAAGPNPRATMA
ncbi:MAG: 4-(cytidine 5'-diphospho)-2-C-methyl-D-erythritol kinase [Rhodobacteraceae bacterium]|nr:4-(cytidine 5'-diphospho)-2-C-methyl-D-erythritol kinase [Paracoccaceae bacterium]